MKHCCDTTPDTEQMQLEKRLLKTPLAQYVNKKHLLNGLPNEHPRKELCDLLIDVTCDIDHQLSKWIWENEV